MNSNITKYYYLLFYIELLLQLLLICWIYFLQDIVKHLRDNWNNLKLANENFLKKPSVTSIEIKKGEFLCDLKLI